MWFYRNCKCKYKYYWSMEYDVRISGDSVKIWLYPDTYDFLCVDKIHKNPNNIYNGYYVGGKLTESQKYHGYLQLARYSNTAMDYLNNSFEQGENGQDELIIFSLLKRSQLTLSSTFLQGLTKGTWTWESKYSTYNRILYEKEEKNNDKNLAIFHPVK